jgi:hypothetical protein
VPPQAQESNRANQIPPRRIALLSWPCAKKP